MNSKVIYKLVEKAESELRNVQQEYYKQEQHIPEYLEKCGFDNLVCNAALDIFLCYVDEKEYGKALKELDVTLDYLQCCLKVVGTYKPDFNCPWHGFDADVYYPLHTAISTLRNLGCDMKENLKLNKLKLYAI